MHLFRTAIGPVVVSNGVACRVDHDWDVLFNTPELAALLADAAPGGATAMEATETPLKPIVSQEVWASGVTYERSRDARMAEADEAGGGDFYDRVYDAERPEIFFKATAARTVGPGEAMHLRSDSKWIVPESELTLAVNRDGRIFGYTVGNDLSCRDIEGENPLYLPQAKTFARCAALGPGILISDTPPGPDTVVRQVIRREGTVAVEQETSLARLKRGIEELVSFLFRENSFPDGCFLMTGTGIVPPDDFCLRTGDVVEITIDGIGTLSNPMRAATT